MLFSSNRIQLCRLFGIPIYLDNSLLILMLFFAFSGGNLYIGIFCALMLLVSIVAHEFGHALTARAFGYPTRDITLSLLGGCASLIALPRKAWQEFLTAIAGPAVSFALSFLGIVSISAISDSNIGNVALYIISEVIENFGLAVRLGDPIRIDADWTYFAIISSYLSIMNMMLGVFNLLPGFPLDGGRVFRSAMRAFMSRARATYIAMVVGRGVAVLIAIRGIFTIFNGGGWGFVTLLIAWMIWKEGWREYQMALAEESFSRWTQDDFDARVSPPPYDR